MTDQADTFLLLSILGLVTVLLVFGMKYFSAARRAQLRVTSEDAYRELADKAAAAQTASAAALASLEADVADLKATLAGIEKLLRDVE